MSSIYTANIQMGDLPSAGTIYMNSVRYGPRPANYEISSGSITVTAEAGVTVSGLTVGNYYSIEATGGPWDDGSGIPGKELQYTFLVSNDGGSTWSGRMGWEEEDNTWNMDNPDWSMDLVAVDSYRARMYWLATTTSIKICVGDNPGEFGDNSGSLDYSLREDLGIFTSGVRLN